MIVLLRHPQRRSDEDDRSLHEVGGVELLVHRRVAQDDPQERLQVVARAQVVPDHHLHRRLGRRCRDEVRPQLPRQERRVVRMAHHEADDVLPVPRPGVAEDRLRPVRVPRRVVEGRVLALGGVSARRLVPVVAPSGEGQRGRVDVGLGVDLRLLPQAERRGLEAGVVPQAEELHELACVVLVRRPPVGVGAVQPEEHRGVVGQPGHQVEKVAGRVRPQKLVLAQHVARVPDAAVRRGEVVVQVERHPLLELVVRAHHPVEPPQRVVAPDVQRVDRAAVHPRRGACQLRGRLRRKEVLDGAVQPERSVVGDLRVRPRESSAPEQAAEVRGGGIPRQCRVLVSQWGLLACVWCWSCSLALRHRRAAPPRPRPETSV